MKKNHRSIAAGILAAGIVFAGTGAAHADRDYTLSGNGRMFYGTASNYLHIWDYKDGDRIYVNYAWTNTVCGPYTDACQPAGWGKISGTSDGVGYWKFLMPTNGRYIILRICNDDFPPDTCSDWKRTEA